MAAYDVRISDWSSDVCSSDLGALQRGPGRRFGQDQGELLAAVAAGDVLAAAVLGQQLAELRQQRVATSVAVDVVEGLEVVDVEHQQRQRQPAPLAAREFARRRFLQVAAVEQAGQRIADRLQADRKSTRLNSSH